MELIPLLSQEASFSKQQSEKFFGHQGINNEVYDLMVELGQQVDGKFRKGCLTTLVDRNQKKILESRKNVVIFHALDDGVINKNYLETINKDYLFENKIHYLEGKHLTPIFQAVIIVNTLKLAFNL